MLSGFMFPINNMPLVIQYLSRLNPMLYFMQIVRGVFLKCAGVSVLWPQMTILAYLPIEGWIRIITAIPAPCVQRACLYALKSDMMEEGFISRDIETTNSISSRDLGPIRESTAYMRYTKRLGIFGVN